MTMHIHDDDRHPSITDDSASAAHPFPLAGWVPLALTPITPSPESGIGRYIAPLWPDTGRWRLADDHTTEARDLFRRQQLAGAGSARRQGLPGSGDRLILTTSQGDALIVFRKFNNPDREFGHGVHCAAFRNEGHFRSCSLIREAVEEWAWKRWPGERLYAYVGGRRIVATNPGHAFRCAGWRRCGVTFGGLIVLQRLPDA